jgi:hypothetical protein
VARADRAAPVEVLLDEVKGREVGGCDHSGRVAPVKILLGEVKGEAAPVELPHPSWRWGKIALEGCRGFGSRGRLGSGIWL